MKGFKYLAVLALALGLIVAGCGGGDDNDSNGSTSAASSTATAETTSTADDSGTLSKDEFVSQANTICVDGKQQLADVQNDLRAKVQADPSQAADAIQEGIKEIVPIVRDMVGRIGYLDAPPELQPKLDEFTTKSNQALDAIEDDPNGAAGRSGAFADLGQLAKDLGLTSCGTAG